MLFASKLNRLFSQLEMSHEAFMETLYNLQNISFESGTLATRFYVHVQKL